MKVYCIVHGFVQGVGYRAFVKMKANQLGIAGSVRNLDDGTVEIFAKADKAALDEFIDEISKGIHGSVEVMQIEVMHEGEKGYVDMEAFDPFEII